MGYILKLIRKKTFILIIENITVAGPTTSDASSQYDQVADI